MSAGTTRRYIAAIAPPGAAHAMEHAMQQQPAFMLAGALADGFAPDDNICPTATRWPAAASSCMTPTESTSPATLPSAHCRKRLAARMAVLDMLQHNVAYFLLIPLTVIRSLVRQCTLDASLSALFCPTRRHCHCYACAWPTQG